jgi:hypothetical protein
LKDAQSYINSFKDSQLFYNLLSFFINIWQQKDTELL